MIVRDGEGVSTLLSGPMRGARSPGRGRSGCEGNRECALVKTSWCGGDPTGAVSFAVGYSRARVNESIVDVGYSRPGRKDSLWIS